MSTPSITGLEAYAQQVADCHALLDRPDQQVHQVLAARRDHLAAKHLAAGAVGVKPQYTRLWNGSPR